MKQFIILVFLSVFLFVQCKTITDTITEENLVVLVNPLMGTDSDYSLSNGNTYPAIALPWGMNFWSPQTGKMGDGWAYTYDADKIKGFKQTNLIRLVEVFYQVLMTTLKFHHHLLQQEY